jgi:hypothetical protein
VDPAGGIQSLLCRVSPPELFQEESLPDYAQDDRSVPAVFFPTPGLRVTQSGGPRRITSKWILESGLWQAIEFFQPFQVRPRLIDPGKSIGRDKFADGNQREWIFSGDHVLRVSMANGWPKIRGLAKAQ